MAGKPCKVCNVSRQKCLGLVVSSLDQLRVKGSESLGCSLDPSVTVVLEDDGTIVQDETYFLCLPSNTKFMLLCDKEVWTPAKRYDGGTAWLRTESVDVEMDAVDSGESAWYSLALQLKQDLASMILMSEADLQSLVDVPCKDLASALGFSEKKTLDLQETLQRALDRREEERQSKELLQLYLKVEKEQSQALQQDGKNALDEADGIDVHYGVGGGCVRLSQHTQGEGRGTHPGQVASPLQSGACFGSKTIQVLKDKTSPETRLSNEELQMVRKQGVEALMDMLGWDRERAELLAEACEEELNKRLQQVRALQSLRAHSLQGNLASTEPHKGETQTKRRK